MTNSPTSGTTVQPPQRESRHAAAGAHAAAEAVVPSGEVVDALAGVDGDDATYDIGRRVAVGATGVVTHLAAGRDDAVHDQAVAGAQHADVTDAERPRVEVDDEQISRPDERQHARPRRPHHLNPRAWRHLRRLPPVAPASAVLPVMSALPELP
jgi:hypothetical protein